MDLLSWRGSSDVGIADCKHKPSSAGGDFCSFGLPVVVDHASGRRVELSAVKREH